MLHRSQITAVILLVLALGMTLSAPSGLATSVVPALTFEQVKKKASFAGIVEIIEVPQEPPAGFWGDQPPVVTVKAVDSWHGAVENTTHAYLWDSDFRVDAIASWNSAMMPGGPVAALKARRITLPAKGTRWVVFAEPWKDGLWRDILYWPRKPILPPLPASRPSGDEAVTWLGLEDHCVRPSPLEEIRHTRNYYGRQKFIYKAEPDDPRTTMCLRLLDITKPGEYWALIDGSAIRITLTSIEPNPQWPVRYQVQKGDTLASIAERFYDDESQASQIAAANNLKDPSRIREGMVLTLPPVRDRD